MGQTPARRDTTGCARTARNGRGVRIVLSGAALIGLGLSLAGCGAVEKFGTIDPKYGVSPSPRVVAEGQKVPKGEGYYKVGKPYTIAGKRYVPQENPHYSEEGIASWYGRDFHGRLTANGEIFDMNSLSAAHKTLPMPSYVRVTNLNNERSVIVRVNNRGPFVDNRLIDLSYHTAELLGFNTKGLARVRVDYVGPAPVGGSDDTKLAMTLREDGKPAELPEGSTAASPVMVASAKPPRVAEVMPKTSGSVPMPQDRPYALGEAADKSLTPSRASAPTTEVAAVGWAQGPAPVAGLAFAGVSAGSDGR